MSLYKALYGRKCQTLVYCEKIKDRKLIGLELVQIILEKLKIIKDKMEATQDRQKHYTNVRRRPKNRNLMLEIWCI